MLASFSLSLLLVSFAGAGMNIFRMRGEGGRHAQTPPAVHGLRRMTQRLVTIFLEHDGE